MSGAREHVVVIAGGGGAIGRAIAACYGRAGSRLALVDLDTGRLQEAADELAAQGMTVRTYACDIVDEASATATIEHIVADGGRLDVLVHCAGLTQVSLARQTELSVYRRVMDVNFFGVVALTRAALPHLVASRGQIIALSSVAGFAPLIGRTGYCASKYALHGYLETLRCELADDGVSVLLACPSFVGSDFARRGLAGDGTTLREDRSITGKPLSPESVAQAIHRAASRRSDLVVLSPQGKLSYWLSRLVPRWYARAMTRRFAAEFARAASHGTSDEDRSIGR